MKTENLNIELIHSRATPEALEFLHFWVFGIWFYIVLIFEPYYLLGYMPSQSFNPVGILYYLPLSVNEWLTKVPVLHFLKIVTAFVLFCVLLKVKLRFSSVIACLLITLLQSICRSFGGIHHDGIILIYAAYFLTAFYLTEGYQNRCFKSSEKFNKYSIPFLGIMIILLTLYSMIGIHRLVSAGGMIFFSKTLLHKIVYNTQLGGIHSSWHPSYLVLQHKWIEYFGRGIFAIVTFLEVFAFLCIVSHQFRRVFLGVMIFFNISCKFFMGFFFWQTSLLLVPILLDITDWFAPKNNLGKNAKLYVNEQNQFMCKFVQWIKIKDRTKVYRLESLGNFSMENRDQLKWKSNKKICMILTDENGVYTNLDAFLNICLGLGGVAKLVGFMFWIPRRWMKGFVGSGSS